MKKIQRTTYKRQRGEVVPRIKQTYTKIDDHHGLLQVDAYKKWKNFTVKWEGNMKLKIIEICLLTSLLVGCSAEPKVVDASPETVEVTETTTEEETTLAVNTEIHNKPEYNYEDYWKIAQESTDIDLGEYYEAFASTHADEDYYAIISYTSATDKYEYWVSIFVKEDGSINSIDIDGWEL